MSCPQSRRQTDWKFHLDFLQNAPASLRKTLRSTIIDLVLATDMKQHFNFISRFQVGRQGWRPSCWLKPKVVGHPNVLKRQHATTCYIHRALRKASGNLQVCHSLLVLWGTSSLLAVPLAGVVPSWGKSRPQL